VRSAYTLVVSTLRPIIMSLCILILHIACVDDTRKGVGQPVACSGPSSADRTAVVTVTATIIGNYSFLVDADADATSFPFSASRNTECIASSITGCRRRPPPPQINRRPIVLGLVRLTPRDSSIPSKHNLPRRDKNATPQHRALVSAAPPTHLHLANNPVR
jgi:hypothetical protein